MTDAGGTGPAEQPSMGFQVGNVLGRYLTSKLAGTGFGQFASAASGGMPGVGTSEGQGGDSGGGAGKSLIGSLVGALLAA